MATAHSPPSMLRQLLLASADTTSIGGTFSLCHVYTPEQLTEKYANVAFLMYLLALVLIVALHHSIYKRGELQLAVSGHDLRPYWNMLLPFSYVVVSGVVGSCSVLFAKSLSNLLRLAMSNGYQMTGLNEGLSLFDAILIVPMFQIAWTFFSICIGFIYFQEYQVDGPE